MEPLLCPMHQWRSAFVGQRRGSVRRLGHPAGRRISLFGIVRCASRVQAASFLRVALSNRTICVWALISTRFGNGWRKSDSWHEHNAEPDAGPNDEERGQPSVPMRASLARSSSSVSFAFGAVCTPAGRPRGVGGARGFLTPPGADFFSWLLAVARLGWPPAATSPAVAESSEIVAGGDSRQ